MELTEVEVTFDPSSHGGRNNPGSFGRRKIGIVKNILSFVPGSRDAIITSARGYTSQLLTAFYDERRG